MIILSNTIDIAAGKLSFDINEIVKCLDEWNGNKNYFVSENILNYLFSYNGRCVHSNIEIELSKVCLLNEFYSTRLSLDEMISMAEYLSENSSKVDGLINKGDSEAVRLITEAIKDKGYRYCYSFATKYCSFAAPINIKNEYPIYDSKIAAVYKSNWKIWNPNNDNRFHKYDFDPWESNDKKSHNTYKYENFKAAVKMMQTELMKIKKLTVKELDQYLWMAVKSKEDKE